MAKKQWRQVEARKEPPFIPESHWTEEREKSVAWKPLTDGQAEYLRAMEEATVVFVSGKAGTGKTWMSAAYATKLLKKGEVRKVVLTRPLVSCGSDGKGIGFFPGDKNEKMQPYLAALLDAFEEHLGKKMLAEMLADGRISMESLELMRGSSFKQSFIICDESQNCGFEQLHLLLTRFGKGCKMVVCGHPGQKDVKADAFTRVWDLMSGRRDIRRITLTHKDVVRHELTAWIDARLSGETGPEDRGDFMDLNCPACFKKVWVEDCVEHAVCHRCGVGIDLWNGEDLDPEPEIAKPGAMLTLEEV